ncbi:MAG: DNA-directed DNA polymerase, partial [Candidatus Pacearchaeota archaeon]|nr:DNA-directed DNA polymerase [Candidatus Pacearchaeota archaeon]
MEIDFVPIDYDYKDIEGKTAIIIYGKSQEKKIAVLDWLEDFFYVIGDKKILKKISKLKISEIIKTKIENKNFREKPVKALKVFCNHKDKKLVSDKIKEKFPETERKERDISPITRYILEKKIKPLNGYKVSGELLNNSPEFLGLDCKLEVDLVLKLGKFQETSLELKPKVLAFDIETEEFEIGKGKILMISLVSDNLKKVLTWKKTKEKQAFVEEYGDESEMIEAFVDYVKKIKPDILTGYFSDGFDLPYLRARAEENKINLELGVDGTKVSFSRGRLMTSSIAGIVHVDLFRFIEIAYAQYLKSETLGLNEVASELIGEGKLENKHLGKKIEHIKEHEWQEYFAYNLQDSVLTYKLFEKIWPDLLEFTQVIGEPLFDVSRNTLSQHVEDYIIHNLERFNEIIENRPLYDETERRKAEHVYEGAFVFQPVPGLYENLAIYDFTSMHTSILVSFNLSPSTLLSRKEKDCYETPEFELNGKKVRFYFSKKTGFLAKLLEEIVEKRKKFKQEYKKNPSPITKARSNAFKVLSASVHGYLGFFGARYYSVEAAASTLAFVRKFNQDIIEKTNKQGFKVVYGDTDSCCFQLNGKTRKETADFLEKLNKELPGIMELELEDFYKRGLWVTKRTGEFGAKKKYALINDENKLKIRGFETVRRDWCNLARDTQNKVLNYILKEGNEKLALNYVKQIIKQIKERKIELKEILIRTQLKKPIEEYKSENPHVTIAKRMKQKGMPVDIGMLMQYYIAEPESHQKTKTGKTK